MSSLKYDFAHILLEKREELPQFMNFIGNLILVVCVCVCIQTTYNNYFLDFHIYNISHQFTDLKNHHS